MSGASCCTDRGSAGIRDTNHSQRQVRQRNHRCKYKAALRMVGAKLIERCMFKLVTILLIRKLSFMWLAALWRALNEQIYIVSLSASKKFLTWIPSDRRWPPDRSSQNCIQQGKIRTVIQSLNAAKLTTNFYVICETFAVLCSFCCENVENIFKCIDEWTTHLTCI